VLKGLSDTGKVRKLIGPSSIKRYPLLVICFLVIGAKANVVSCILFVIYRSNLECQVKPKQTDLNS
jgi:hypothetical protein